MFTCPRNHASETNDFCSVCGIEMTGPPAPQPMPPAIREDLCPECGAPIEAADQVMCEICGFSFQTKTAGVPALGPSAAGQVQWDVVVTVDANLFGQPEENAPVHEAPQVFTLFEVINYIGRGGPDVRVHVPIQTDDAVSRRQAVLTRQPDGGLTVRDLGSANGTFLNGKPLKPGVDTAVKDGDVLGLGAWTRITIRNVSN